MIAWQYTFKMRPMIGSADLYGRFVTSKGVGLIKAVAFKEDECWYSFKTDRKLDRAPIVWAIIPGGYVKPELSVVRFVAKKMYSGAKMDGYSSC